MDNTTETVIGSVSAIKNVGKEYEELGRGSSEEEGCTSVLKQWKYPSCLALQKS